MQGPSGSGSSGSDSGKQAPPPYPGNQRAPPYPTNQVAPPYPVNQMAPPPYPVNQVSRPYPVNQMAPNHGTPMQPMYPAAQNPGMPMQPVYPSAPNPGTPMYPVNPTAPPLHSPPQQSPQVGMQYVPVRGGCRNCGGFISHEYDSGMLACAIILSIICFPCGLLTFCCIDKEARCRQCGMAAGLAPGYNNRR